MKDRIFLYIRSALSLLRVLISRLFAPRALRSALVQDFSLTTRIFPHNGGRIFLGRHIHTKRNVVFDADGGILDIGEGGFFNNGCMAVAKEHIKIGKNVSFGPYVTIYDHDHNIHSDKTIHDSGFVTSPVIIGDDVWIGAGSVILRGTTLGNGCVVGAGSVVKGNYSAGSVIIQKRVTRTEESEALDIE